MGNVRSGNVKEIAILQNGTSK